MLEDQIEAMLRTYYGIYVREITFLRKGGSETYRIQDASRSYFLKRIGNAFQDTAEQSALITRYLESKGFPVPKIIHGIHGELSVRGEDVLYILYEYIEGEDLKLKSRAVLMGELTGRLHQLMKEYPHQIPVRGYDFFIERYLRILERKLGECPELDRYRELGNLLWEKVKHLPMGYCHGDLHCGNVMQTKEGKLYLLDFDTSCIALRMFDLMVMCDTTDYFQFDFQAMDDATETFLDFSEGYSKYIKLTNEELESFYDWVAIRHYQLQATIVEIYGIDCIDQSFIKNQLEWLSRWCEQSKERRR